MLKQFADPLVYLLLAAIAISTIAWVAEGATGVPVDAIVIALIVIANAMRLMRQAATPSSPRRPVRRTASQPQPERLAS